MDCTGSDEDNKSSASNYIPNIDGAAIVDQYLEQEANEMLFAEIAKGWKQVRLAHPAYHR